MLSSITRIHLTKRLISSNFNNFKHLSTKNQQYLIEEKDNYVVFSLNKPATNSLSLEYLVDLNKEFDRLEKNKNINGIILTSNVKNIFSSGLDLNEMYKPNKERLSEFWRLMQDFWIKLYGSKKIFIAAINGHAPAAGCQIVMSCDYRIMVRGNYTIGISAVRLGVQAPFWFRETMINTIGYRETEKSLQLGVLFNPDEALRVNLIDELVDHEKLLTTAEDQMKKWLKIPNMAREMTKNLLRNQLLRKLLDNRENDLKFFIETNTEKSVQEALGKYLEALKNKKSK